MLGAHYDSWRSLGANDNASGVICLLEALKVLSQFKFENTIEFVFFTAEEQGYLGSKFYLSQFLEDERRSIVAAFIVDMIGNNPDKGEGEYEGKEDINLMYDKIKPWISQKLALDTADAIRKCLPDLPIAVSHSGGRSRGSDNNKFQEKEIATIFISEDKPDEYSTRFMHTENDTIEYIDFDFFAQAVKAVILSVAAEAGKEWLK